jgi:uncharacterized protein YbbC (DUF1343 family)/CubicO group peptidase (beta-lactamase class C family)
MNRIGMSLFLAFLGLNGLTRADSPPLAQVAPAEAGFDGPRLGRVADAVRLAVARGEVPGAVVAVGRKDKLALVLATGDRVRGDRPEPMTRDTIFDLASLTKPVATASAVLALVEDGKLKLTDTLGALLPAFDNHGKGAITVEQLLRHRAGFVADNPLRDYLDGPEKARERLANLDLVAPPGSRFLYSDVNFIVLGLIVESVTGQSLNDFARGRVFERIGMGSTRFRPDDAKGPAFEAEIARTAPTEPLVTDHPDQRESVHDPRSRALGGIAGHAGLFSTVDDLARFAATVLNAGVAPDGKTIVWKPETVASFHDAGATPEGERRGLGWDVDTGFSAPRGDLFGPASFGHTGFTGTSIWIDPDTGVFVILLTSRLYPDGKGATPTRLRREVATLAAQAIDRPPFPPGSSDVKCGIDVLIDREFTALKGKRVGLVTNHTGRARDGRPTIDVLHKAPGVTLVRLFSPEHGIRGKLDRAVDDATDEATGLPVVSLYGASAASRKPKPEHLADIDVLVYDIQDIGCRFYTYISTLGLVLEAGAESGKPVVVLDRPNPIGGVMVGGPVRDEAYASFIAWHELPVVHGMTVGELARMFAEERKVDVKLDVVPCQGWRRSMRYDATGLEWVNPSPNMRSLTQAIVYPGVGLLEGTNLATGRGTDTPFERVGAPYLDPVQFARALNGQNLPGVRFIPTRFTPTERQFSGTECGGVYIEITNRDDFDPIDLGFALAVVLRSGWKDQWKPDALEKFLCDRAVYEAILAGKGVADLKAMIASETRGFLARRRAFLTGSY